MKKIRDNLYTHISYIESLPKNEFYMAFYVAMTNVVMNSEYEGDFHYVKYNKKTKSFTFVSCDGWDTLPEPICRLMVKVSKNNTCKITEYKGNNPPIIHGKHLFVGKNYKGFNVKEAKKRWDSYQGEEWIDKSRMGFLKWWEENSKL